MKFLKAPEGSASQYFEINGYTIRLSDHLSPIYKNDLNIITTINEQFIVCYGRKCMSISTYKELKGYVKSFILTTSLVPIIVKEVTREVIVPVPKESELTEEETRILKYFNGIKPQRRVAQINNLSSIYCSKESKNYRKSRGIKE